MVGAVLELVPGVGRDDRDVAASNHPGLATDDHLYVPVENDKGLVIRLAVSMICIGAPIRGELMRVGRR